MTHDKALKRRLKIEVPKAGRGGSLAGNRRLNWCYVMTITEEEDYKKFLCLIVSLPPPRPLSHYADLLYSLHRIR